MNTKKLLFIFLSFIPLISFTVKSQKTGVSAKIQYPVLPELPNIPNETYLVTNFGAKPDDGIDDTKAIQNAINTVSEKGGGRILFPDGIYDVSIQGDGSKSPNYALQISSKIALEAQNSRKATLRLANNQPKYMAILHWKISGNTDDVRIKGLVFDANSVNNKPVTYDDFKYIEGGKVVRWLPRFVLHSRNGKRVLVDDVHFTNLLNINTINIGAHTGSTGEQLEKVSDVTISNCLFDNLGWKEYDFDHSTVYTQANRFLLKNNILKSIHGAGTLSARCAIEIHGSDQTVTNNEVDGFTIGINATGSFILSHRQLIENNKFSGVARGVYFWSYKHKSWPEATMLSDVVIRKNQISLAPDAWQDSSVPSRKHLAGIATNPENSSPIENLLIEQNTILTSGYGKSLRTYFVKSADAGMSFINTDFRNVRINNNVIGRNLGPSIGGNASFDGLVINGNKLFEPEMASSSEYQKRAAINLTGEVRNCTITNNTIKNVQQPNNVEQGIFINATYKESGNTIEPATIPMSK